MRSLYRWAGPLLLTFLTGFSSVSAAEPSTGNRAARPPLQIELDKTKVDLKQHRLELKLSRDAAKITIKVVGDSGGVLAEQTTDFGGSRAGTPLIVNWTPSREETVARIELFAYDTEGFYKGIALTPWTVSVPHEEVNFASNSFKIGDGERSKLEASYAKIVEMVAKHASLGKVTLFLAGHTDTVGSDLPNLKLSQQRALAIGTWFRHQGLSIAIAYEGFGESSTLIKTADEVAEPRNRRVDYILSLEEPVLKTSNFRTTWKRLLSFSKRSSF